MVLERAATEVSSWVISDWIEWRSVVLRESAAPNEVRARVSSSMVVDVVLIFVVLYLLAIRSRRRLLANIFSSSLVENGGMGIFSWRFQNTRAGLPI